MTASIKEWKPSKMTEAYVLKRAKEAKRLFKKIKSPYMIAEKMKVNPVTVYRWLYWIKAI